MSGASRYAIPILLALIVFPVPACAGKSIPADTLLTPMESPAVPERGYFKGFAAVLPPNGDFEMSYKQAGTHADFVNTWVGAEESGYWNLAEHLSGWWGETFVDELTRGNGMFPILNLSFIDVDAGGRLTLKEPDGISYDGLADPDFRDAYRDAAVLAVKASRPAYISIGNEVNRWYEHYGASPENPNGFAHFVSLYEETYDAIKAISPATKVFCVFAREVVAENRAADPSALGLFDESRLDLVAYTSYPFAVKGIRDPSAIPDDYYTATLAATGMAGKPFGFTEVAWSSLPEFGGESAQRRFMHDVAGRLTRAQGVDLHLLGWWALYDIHAAPHQSGLIASDGREKPAYEAWKSL